MKKPEEYLQLEIDKMEWHEDPFYDDGYYDGKDSPILLAIKQAQIDAIEKTVKLCAKEAKIMWDRENSIMRQNDLYIIDEQSILNCAEILKQQL